MDPSQFTKASLHLISCDSRVLEPRHNESNSAVSNGVSRTCERESCRPNLEMPGPEALPLSHDTLQLRTLRYTCFPRKAERHSRRLTLRSTYPECEPSTACDLSCGDVPRWRVPTSFPCAHEIRASWDAEYCADGKLAFPWATPSAVWPELRTGW